MATYKTPGVYIEEIPTLPASIASVETALPAFIGYTAETEYRGKSLLNKPTRISSFVEFESIFGSYPASRKYDVTVNTSTYVPESVVVDDGDGYPLYTWDAVRMFYANGGGDCYIVSVGEHDAVVKSELLAGIAALRKVDEPTLLVFPDAVNLADAADIAEVQQAALTQCAELQDRFTVMDVWQDTGDTSLTDSVTVFRDNIGINNLKYGAAYGPYIHTTLPFDVNYTDITLNVDLSLVSTNPTPVTEYNQAVANLATIEAAGATYESDYGNVGTALTAAEVNHYISVAMTVADDIYQFRTGGTSALTNPTLLAYVDALVAAGGELEDLVQTLSGYHGGWTTAGLAPALALFPASPPYAAGPANDIYGTAVLATAVTRSRSYFRAVFEDLLDMYNGIIATANSVMSLNEGLLRAGNSIYANIQKAIKAEGFVMPPSGAVVGQYAQVDRTRGVWKAPANVSLNGVQDLSFQVDDNEQEELNVDVTSGKSVNVIRNFKGKGKLIWGARTLAGNDNEWRYVPVRRTFIMAEESIKKATEYVVFEPNDANTWLRVKGMIRNYLTELWRQGALAGAKPDAAFYVKVGLGETMTSLDILEGRMIVEIGMAVVRPAEFIVLRFMHKLQES